MNMTNCETRYQRTLNMNATRPQFSNHHQSQGLSVRRAEAGLTLLEILIVIAILGTLITIIGTQVVGGLDKANVKEARLHMSRISEALETYRLDCQTYPTTEEGLQALVSQDAALSCRSWGPGAYLKTLPKDPWGREYLYESDGNEFTITSYGSDRKPGGKDAGVDIVFPEAEK